MGEKGRKEGEERERESTAALLSVEAFTPPPAGVEREGGAALLPREEFPESSPWDPTAGRGGCPRPQGAGRVKGAT